MQTEDKLNQLLKKYEEESIRKNDLIKAIEILETKYLIIQYLKSTKELAELRKSEKNNLNEIQSLKIKLCGEKYGGHFHVVDRPKKGDFWENETNVTCIHCGKKTKISEHICLHVDDWDYRDSIEQELLITVQGVYADEELPELKNIYDKVKNEFPNASDDDIGNQIKLIKKMKGGKLC